jgi:hypothetical protein
MVPATETHGRPTAQRLRAGAGRLGIDFLDTRYYPSIRLCMGLNVTHADSPNGANARQMWHESPCAALGTTAQGLRPMTDRPEAMPRPGRYYRKDRPRGL